MDNLRGMIRWLSEKRRWMQAWWQQKSPESAIKTDNPLLNDLVLKLVYGHLSFSDKKSFRLVCKTWLDTSLGLWRKQSKFVIVKKGEITTPTDLVQSSSEEKEVTRFNLDLYKLSDYPLLNFVYKIEDVPINLTHEDILNMMAERLLDDNWEPMEISESCTLQKENFILLFQQILEDFPHLKVLCIEVSPTPGDLGVFKESFEREQADNLETLQFTSWNSKIDVEEAERILNIVPNIKKLHLKGSVCESFLKALKSPFTSGKHILLEKLTINRPYTNALRRGFLLPDGSHILLRDYLDVARPPLKTLKASFLDYFIEPMKMPISIISGMELYREIVSKVGNTLTCLDFRVTIQSQVWFIALAGCSLPNLTRLFVRFRDTCENDKILIKFDFGTLRGTPRLKILHLDIEWICQEYVSERTFGTILEANELEYKGKTREWLPSPILLESLEDFRFEMYHKPTEGCWKALAEIMPNVKNVQAIFDEETLPLVLELWPELKHCFLSQHSSVSDKFKMKEKREKATEIKFGELCKEEDWDKW